MKIKDVLLNGIKILKDNNIEDATMKCKIILADLLVIQFCFSAINSLFHNHFCDSWGWKTDIYHWSSGFLLGFTSGGVLG